jgi:hypothetical protein
VKAAHTESVPSLLLLVVAVLLHTCLVVCTPPPLTYSRIEGEHTTCSSFTHSFLVVCRYDPSKIFEPILMSRLIAKQPNLYSAECDVQRSCYCTQDVHCGKGHACVQLASFPEYKVCKPSPMFPKLG